MFRTDADGKALALPTPEAVGTQGYFTEGDPQTGTPATVVSADWLNAVQEEIVAAALSVSGSSLDKTVRTQLLSAIKYWAAGTKETIASASASTVAASDAAFIDITGTTTITGLGTAVAGVLKTLRFLGALQLTHNGSNFVLPNAGNNITVAAGDVATFRSDGSGAWTCVSFIRASGKQTAGDTGRLIAKTIFIADGTWTKNSLTNSVEVIVTGGGGGAGGSSVANAGAGGGAGGTAIKRITSGLGSTEAVTVGAGGAGGASGGGNGSTGGTSSFGSHCSASGGIYGQTNANAGAGGTPTNGDNDSQEGGGGATVHNNVQGGTGGASYWGGGGRGGAASAAGLPGAASGAGGGGGGNGADQAGGPGKVGIVVVYEYT